MGYKKALKLPKKMILQDFCKPPCFVKLDESPFCHESLLRKLGSEFVGVLITIFSVSDVPSVDCSFPIPLPNIFPNRVPSRTGFDRTGG